MEFINNVTDEISVSFNQINKAKEFFLFSSLKKTNKQMNNN